MEQGVAESIMVVLTQFGAAGLIGLLWILERRTAMQRDRQLQEAHERLMAQRQAVDSLLQVVRDNTAAMQSMEHVQRQLIDHLQRFESSRRAGAA